MTLVLDTEVVVIATELFVVELTELLLGNGSVVVAIFVGTETNNHMN